MNVIGLWKQLGIFFFFNLDASKDNPSPPPPPSLIWFVEGLIFDVQNHKDMVYFCSNYRDSHSILKRNSTLTPPPKKQNCEVKILCLSFLLWYIVSPWFSFTFPGVWISIVK